MKLITIAFLALCVTLQTFCHAGQLQIAVPFSDGQTVHASDLNNAINNATIQSVFVSGQPINNLPLSSDYVLSYSPTLNGLYRVQLVNIFNNSQSITLLSSGTPNFYANDLFSFYNSGSTNLNSVTFSNLVLDISSNVNPAYLNFAPTNFNAGATNLPVLSPYSPAQPNPYYLTNAVQILVWDTNGVPHSLTISNLLGSYLLPISTNEIPYIYNQIFLPQNVYGTNSFGFTNAWGLQTGFAITNLFMTNNLLVSASNTPTLTDTDSIPVMSYSQKTNTTATLGSVYQYFTNKNSTFFTQLYTLTNNGAQYLSTNHPYAGTPIFARWVVICITNEIGYVVGDEVDANCLVDSADNSRHATYGVSSTNFWFTMSTAAGAYQLPNRTNPSSPVSLTSVANVIQNWKLKGYVRP